MRLLALASGLLVLSPVLAAPPTDRPVELEGEFRVWDVKEGHFTFSLGLESWAGKPYGLEDRRPVLELRFDDPKTCQAAKKIWDELEDRRIRTVQVRGLLKKEPNKYGHCISVSEITLSSRLEECLQGVIGHWFIR